jgi:hypothetical protein
LIIFYYFALLKLHIKNYHIKYLISTVSVYLHLPSTIHYLPFTIHHSPFTIHHSPSIVNHRQPPSTIIHIIHISSTTHHPPSIVHHHPPSSTHPKLFTYIQTQEPKAEIYKIEDKKFKNIKKNTFLKESFEALTSKLTHISKPKNRKPKSTKLKIKNLKILKKILF